ncbi:MAG: hypothetical protein GY822_24590 [Deltaproteobacteria bacterium]|nr:hypothetical protein [Deltaproteobacteria bacterium]
MAQGKWVFRSMTVVTISVSGSQRRMRLFSESLTHTRPSPSTPTDVGKLSSASVPVCAPSFASGALLPG